MKNHPKIKRNTFNSTIFKTLCFIFSVSLYFPGEALSQSPADPASSWTHRGQSAGRRGGWGEIPDSPRLLWNFKSRSEFISPPAVLNGMVFIGDTKGKLSCLRLSDGRRLWDRRFSGSFVASPVGEGNNLFAAVSRRESWLEREKKSGLFSTSYVLKTVTEEKGEVVCLDTDRGRRKWRRRFFDLLYSTPALSGQHLVLGCNNGKIYCLDAERGKELWDYKTEKAVTASPAVLEDRVLAASRDGNLYCLDLASGKERWSFKTGGPITASPACARGRVFFGSGDKYFYCLDIAAGRPIWKFRTGEAVTTHAVISGKLIYFSSMDKKMHCLEGGTGKEIWSFSLPDRVVSSPIVSSGKVLFGDGEGKLYCLHALSGDVIWKYSLPWSGPSWLSLAGGKILAATECRYLYCLGEGGLTE